MNGDTPYLPPTEPSDNPAVRKSSSKRVIVLWLFLIILLLSIYRTADPGPHHQAAPSTESGSSVWASWLPLLTLLGILFYWYRRQFRGGAQFNAKLEPGLLALADGDLARAAEVFASVTDAYRKQPFYAAAARLSLATARARQGQLQRAIEAAVASERTPGLLFGDSTRLYASIQLGMLYALRGDVLTAQRWCESARQRLSRAQNRTGAAAALRLSEAIVRARAGQREEALRLLERDWRRLEESLTATLMKEALLLRAFCAASDPTRSLATPWLSTLRKGELSWMATEWPELAAFLAAHDL